MLEAAPVPAFAGLGRLQIPQPPNKGGGAGGGRAKRNKNQGPNLAKARADSEGNRPKEAPDELLSTATVEQFG